MVRYADDIIVVTKSKRAAEHMLESCQKFLEGKLKLTMNLQKSKVVSMSLAETSSFWVAA